MKVLKTKGPQLCFESYGVSIRIGLTSSEALPICERLLEEALPGCHTLLPNCSDEHVFQFQWGIDGQDAIGINGRTLARDIPRHLALETLRARIRQTVAEFAPRHVFIHAGVVAQDGHALIIPGRTMHGKTSLVLELASRGAIYYSDEYAILDADGLLHAFPKTLSIRGELEHYQQREYAPGVLGLKTSTETVPVGMVMLTRYKAGARWNPKLLTPTFGISELIRNTVSIRKSPEFVIVTLTKATAGAKFWKSDRPEAVEVADEIFAMLNARG